MNGFEGQPELSKNDRLIYLCYFGSQVLFSKSWVVEGRECSEMLAQRAPSRIWKLTLEMEV